MSDEDSRVREAYCFNCKQETTHVFDDTYRGGFGSKYIAYKCTKCDERIFEEPPEEKFKK